MNQTNASLVFGLFLLIVSLAIEDDDQLAHIADRGHAEVVASAAPPVEPDPQPAAARPSQRAPAAIRAVPTPAPEPEPAPEMLPERLAPRVE